MCSNVINKLLKKEKKYFMGKNIFLKQTYKTRKFIKVEIITYKEHCKCKISKILHILFYLYLQCAESFRISTED